jgi:hypothetical protein
MKGVPKCLEKIPSPSFWRLQAIWSVFMPLWQAVPMRYTWAESALALVHLLKILI